jgi:hypothetical protein
MSMMRPLVARERQWAYLDAIRAGDTQAACKLHATCGEWASQYKLVWRGKKIGDKPFNLTQLGEKVLQTRPGLVVERYDTLVKNRYYR